MTLGPTARARRNKRATRRRRAASIYQQVDARDEQTCRACAMFCGHERHLHHIRYRSQGGLETTANLVTLCGRGGRTGFGCHGLVHNGLMRIVGDDANGELQFEHVRALGEVTD